ncbi:MAG: hypothetical protein H0V36_07660 [Chloroflexi bacterium]|nr:hypothetical protein [Chloroflexota bacterium]
MTSVGASVVVPRADGDTSPTDALTLADPAALWLAGLMDSNGDAASVSTEAVA